MELILYDAEFRDTIVGINSGTLLITQCRCLSMTSYSGLKSDSMRWDGKTFLLRLATRIFAGPVETVRFRNSWLLALLSLALI